MGSQQLKPQEERWVIIVLIGVQIAHIVDAMLIMPLGPQFMRIWGITPTDFGLLVSCYAGSACISALVCAFLMNHYDRRSALIFLYLGFLTSIVFCISATDYTTLLLARSLSGVFGGVLNAIVYSIIADLIPEERRGYALGKVGVAFPISSVAGVPIGLALANLYGWHTPYICLLIISVLIGLGIVKFIPPLKDHVKNINSYSSAEEIRTILKETNHRRSLALISVLSLGGFSVVPFISPYMVNNVGLTEVELPLIYLFGGLAAIFTSRVIGRLCDTHGKVKIFTLVTGISTFPIVALTNLGEVPLWLALCMSTVFMIFVSGRFVPAMAIVSAASRPASRAGFLSLNSSAQQLAMGVATIMSGMVIKETNSGSIEYYWIVGIISVFCALSAVLISRTIKA